MIELSHISKEFVSGKRTVHAVQDVSLTIDKGEIFGMIGFSGAGKSTLVRCINLLERPTSGKVIVDGQDMLSLSAKELRQARKKIGMIFQHFNLMPSRTVAGNVAYPLRGSGLSKQQIEEKVQRLLDLVGIGDKAEAYPKQLSGGQKQRVAIARALANDPNVLLCDEATSALDPQTTKAILQLLKHLNETLGITVVIITHEMAVVKEICHRVAVMEHGKVVESGEVFNIFANPREDITKSFIHTTSNLRKIEEPHRGGFAGRQAQSGRAYRAPELHSAQCIRAAHLDGIAQIRHCAQHHLFRYRHRAECTDRRHGSHYQRRAAIKSHRQSLISVRKT